MNQSELKKSLSDLPLGEIKYFESIGSTNDEALAWAANDARDMSLVVADEQTAGRGRRNRKWFTPPGTALAFSLVLRPTAHEEPHLSRLVGLAGLSVADPLVRRELSPRIKWPNDILLNGRKIGGILIESVWSGSDVDCVVIGIGINVLEGSVPHGRLLHFPATSLETALEEPVDRLELLHEILAAFGELRPRLGTDEFMKKWEQLLAYRGSQVQVEMGEEGSLIGSISGLNQDGTLQLRDEHGQPRTVPFGDVRLRPQA